MRTTTVMSLFGLMIFAALAIGGKNEKEFFIPAPPNAPPRVATDSPDPALKQLIDDLGSEDWRTREKAGRDLAAMGEKALPHLRKALITTENPEVQRRLVILVRKMDRDRLVEPKRITLSAKDLTAKEIFEAIAKQTGYRIEYGGNGGVEAKHSFEFNNTPFWQAIDAVATAAGCNAVSEYEDDIVRIYNQEVVNPYVAYSGPFRFIATGISSNRNVQLAGISRRGDTPRVNEYINLSFQIQSEPKNPMMGMMVPELLEAKDEFGGNLMPPQERNNNYRLSNYINGGYRGHNSHISVNLTRGDRAATTIKSLKGRVGVVLLAATVPDVAVTDAMKVKKKTFTGRTVEVEFEGIDEDANQKGVYLVSFTAKRAGQTDPNRNDDYVWSNSIWQRLELSDEKGNKYYCHGPTTHNNNGQGTVQLVVQFGPDDRRGLGRGGATPKLGPPTKFVLNEWQTVTHEVTFEFKDIPLP